MKSDSKLLNSPLDRSAKTEANTRNDIDARQLLEASGLMPVAQLPQENTYSYLASSQTRDGASTPANIPQDPSTNSITEATPPRRACEEACVHVSIPESDVECSMEHFPNYVKHAFSDDPSEQYLAARYFHQLLSIEENPYIQEVIDAGVVPRLVRFVENDDQQKLQLEATYILASIVRGSGTYTHLVVDSGALPNFIRLIRSINDALRDEVTWALGNIAGDCVSCRDRVLSMGAVPALVQALEIYYGTQQRTTVRNIAWALSNLFRGIPSPAIDDLRPSFPWLPQLLSSDDTETLEDSCWTLAFLSESHLGENEVDALFAGDVATQLVYFLRESSLSIQKPVLRTLGNIISGDDSQTQSIVDLQIVPVLRSLLDNVDKEIVKDSCWVISNITVGTPSQIQVVIESGIFPKLIELMYLPEWLITEWSTDWCIMVEIQKEVAWAVCNATSRGTHEQIEHLIDNSVVPSFSALLYAPDAKLVTIALEALENILKSFSKSGRLAVAIELIKDCGGAKSIESLQSHRSNAVNKRVVRILGQYLVGHEERK